MGSRPEPTNGLSPGRSTVLKTVTLQDATPKPATGSSRMRDRPSLPLPYGPSETPPDLAEVVTAWPDLAGPIRAGILAMIRSASGKGHGR